MHDPTDTSLEVAVTEYVAEAEAKLASAAGKVAEAEVQHTRWAEEVVKTAYVLRDCGLLQLGRVDDFIKQATEDPNIALRFLSRTASLIDPNGGLGAAGAPPETKIAEDDIDPFVKRLFPERFHG